jgi:phospholipid/cholesterol/gamma-HCH transport system substrate-binding protein
VIPSIKWTATKLAIFTMVTIAVTTWLAAIIGNFSLFSSPYEVSAQFTDATGLMQGDVVKAAGVTVGRVEEIRVEDGVAKVTMSLQDGAEVPSDVRAQIRFRNLIGQRMVTLVQPSDGSGTSELLEPGDQISLDKTDPAFDLSALFNGLRPLIRSTSPEDINIVARTLVEALQGREDQVAGFLGNVADISEMLASKDTELSSLLDNVNIVTDDLKGRGDQLNATLADLNTFFGALQESRGDLEVALQTLDESATRFGRIIEANDENIEGELKDLRILFDAIDDKRDDLRGALRALPEFLIGVERVTSYGQWGNSHLIHICKDDFGTCGSRWRP